MSERILAAARKLAASVLREREVKAAINWRDCEQSDENEFDERGEMTYMGHAPCPFDDADVPRERWCPSCERNWTLKGEVIVLRRQRAGFIRRLVNAVAAEDAR